MLSLTLSTLWIFAFWMMVVLSLLGMGLAIVRFYIHEVRMARTYGGLEVTEGGSSLSDNY